LPEDVIEDDARSAAEAREVNLESFWHPHGRNSGRVVLKFADSNSIPDAEALAKLLVVIPASERAPLEPGAVFLDQIVGCKVFDHGSEIGAVEVVDFTAGAPLLIVRAPDSEELLVPFAEEFIIKFAPDERRLEMRLPEGLLDVNRRDRREPQP
jgi:16S rRNA processing protein RimM